MQSGEGGDAGLERPARILIVDDEASNRDLLSVILRADGYEIETAPGGEAALAAIALSPPDLVVLDVFMPGMDGNQVATQLKEDPATQNIPIIMITALDGQDVRMEGLHAGAENFLTRPIDPTELSLRVRNLLRLKTYNRLLEGEVDSSRAELVESERLYRSTFDTAPVGIGHLSEQGAWLRVNQRLCDLLGYTREELVGLPIQTHMAPEDVTHLVEPFARLAAGKLRDHVVEELRLRRRDGTTIWVRSNNSVHRGSGGEILHFIAVFEDITERRALEAQVRQASKMDAIGRLASGVAHDFNNLLTVILGFADMLLVDRALQDHHRDDLGEIVKAAGRAAGLTGQLLAFSRQQVLHAAPLDVNALIFEMTGMLQRLIGEHVHVRLALAPRLDLAHADRGQLEQVLMNLVVNARDAMPDGGRVTIETRDVEIVDRAASDGVEPILPGHYVQIVVSDTGSGMTAETLRRLFEPFYTTKETGKGTGLGLSTTYGIVKQSQGYIAVESELGHGTTFTVHLPRSATQLATPVVSVPAPPTRRVSETVLLVEDEVGVRVLAKRILDRAGYHVLEAKDGDDAERIAADHTGPIDLVLTDLMMPGCGGFELLERLQVHTPEVRVLYMSGYTEAFPMLEQVAGGHLPFMQKPFTAAELRRQVRAALDR